MVSSQWKRDTVGSSSTRSLDGCEPRAQRSAASAQVRPWAGPAVTTTRKRRMTRPGPVLVGRVTNGCDTATDGTTTPATRARRLSRAGR